MCIRDRVKWLNIYQFKEENLTEYTKRVKYHRDIVKSQIGTDLLNYYVKQTDKYLEASLLSERNKLLHDLFEELCAYIQLKGCDKTTYKSLVKGFVNQYSLKNNQYPKTMQDMTNAVQACVQ